MNIEIVLAYEHTQEINALFSEYTNMLITNDSSFQNYLDIQHYEEEINHLEEKYGMPSGRLYLAYYNREIAGCIGLKNMDKKNCEMKRLYVRPQFRGKNIGKLLIQKIIIVIVCFFIISANGTLSDMILRISSMEISSVRK